tara:strand:- start:1766 stop:2350 length:585 start_codon:yes stop_codon:yes gene_type:complete
MTLFEEEDKDEMPDPFSVCPNSDGTPHELEDRGQRIFNIMLMHTREWDRLRVAEALHRSHTSRKFLLTVMSLTYPQNNVIQFAARELVRKVPDRLLCSILAFAHNGAGGRIEIIFPAKKEQTAPRSLLRAFGLRGSEAAWASRLMENESFVRGVANQIDDKDWKLLIYDKATLLKKDTEEDTVSLLTFEQGVSV